MRVRKAVAVPQKVFRIGHSSPAGTSIQRFGSATNLRRATRRAPAPRPSDTLSRSAMSTGAGAG